jgi:hypothetical protein
MDYITGGFSQTALPKKGGQKNNKKNNKKK